MDDLAKCDIYTKLLNSLNAQGELKGAVSIPTYTDQIKLIKNDLVSSLPSDQETALQMLQILLENNIHSIQKDVVDILNENVIQQRIRNSILEGIKNYIRNSLKSGNVDDLVLLYVVWSSYDVKKFSALLKQVVSDQECQDDFKRFLIDILLPKLFKTNATDEPAVINSIDFALELASVSSITILNEQEYNTFLETVNDYVTIISDLRNNNFVCWHKLWIFLIKLFGQKLHHSMNLINKLLRVVEHAFRDSSFEQRLRGYDCWKELIDNCSLDPKHISSEKQIRLLLTPLRAKFSRQEAVIIRRFDVFVYLLEKLGDQAVLVLKEFLEFCFGEVGENTDPHKAGQGKSIPGLWLRSANILLALLGHSHENTEHCIETNFEIHLSSPLLNSSNISGAHCHVINSVTESCKLLKNVEMAQNKTTVLRCFWKSLFGIILDDNFMEKDNCIATVGKVLDSLLKDTDPYSHSIASIIFKEAVKLDAVKVLPLVLKNLDHFVNIVFSVPLGKESFKEVDTFLNILSTGTSTPETTSNQTKQLFNAFKTYNTTETNVDLIAALWIFLANKLDDFFITNSLDFLKWPLSHLHQLSDKVKEVAIFEHYQRLIVPFVEKSDEIHLALFKQFEKTLKNNPLLLDNVLKLVTLFNAKIDNKDITTSTLDMLCFMLLIPPSDQEANERESIKSYIKKLFEAKLGQTHNRDIIKKLCSCIEHLLKSKHYDILPLVEQALAELPDNIKWIYNKNLSMDFLIDIFEKETNFDVTENVHKIIELLRNVKSPESGKDITAKMPLGGRSAKIASLIKQLPKSPLKAVASSPPSLRLFGKDIETHSPLKAIGSHLAKNKMTPKKEKQATPQKKKQQTLIDDESNSKFVLIESEVKLDREKLTEHQKETLKKRREDIPALYQDLSQSCESNSVTVSNENNDFKKPATIVKPLEDQSDNMKEKRENVVVKTKSDLKNIEGTNAVAPSKEKRKNVLDNTKSELKNIEGTNDIAPPKETREKVLAKTKSELKNIEGTNDVAPPKKKRSDKTRDGEQRRKLEPEDKKKEKKKAQSKLSTKSTVEETDNKKEEVPEKPDNAKKLKLEVKITKEKILKPPITAEDELDSEPPKKKRARRSYAKPEIDLRKSRRKSLPTEKFSQSELFKKSTENSDPKPATLTQSEIFCVNDLDNIVNPSQIDDKSESVIAILDPINYCSSRNGEPNKRKRVSTSEDDDDDDIIESSQDTSVSNNVLQMQRTLNKMPDDVSCETLDEKPVKRGRGRPIKTKKTRGRPVSKKKLEEAQYSGESTTESDMSSVSQADGNEKVRKRKSSRKRVNVESFEKRRRSPRKLDKEEPASIIVSPARRQLLLEETIANVSTQSNQDTQTQETESEQVLLNLDLPVKPKLTESEEALARMDTASFPLNDLEGFKGFNESLTNHSNGDNDQTLVASEEVVTSGTIQQSPIINDDNADIKEPEVVPESEIIINNEEAAVASDCRPEEVVETEDLVEVLEQTNVETELSSPVREGTPPIADGTPGALEASLPSSPVTGDTPNRISELLTNTVNISPIAIKQTLEEETIIDERKLVPVALKFENEDIDRDAQKQKSPEKGDDAPQKMDANSPEKAEKQSDLALDSPPKDEETKVNNGTTLVEKTSRFGWIRPASPATQRFFNKRKAALNMSPSASRIKKLMSNVKLASQSECVEDINPEDILTFTREIPSPLAIPRSILKRKHSEIHEEGLSPCSKRKRVNFSDPCTTSKKLFLKEETAPAQCLFGVTDDELDKQFLEVLTSNHFGDASQTESDNIETEPSLQINNPMLLRDDVPIYPELIECVDNISLIARKLTGPMFINTLLSKFNAKNIQTIGDLASQSEVSIARLPFKTPMLVNIYKALDNYYHKCFKCKGDPEENLISNGEAESEVELPSSEEVEMIDVKDELARVLERARNENVSSDTLCSLIFTTSDHKQIVTWMKSHFNLNSEDFLEETDYDKVVKHITKSVGIPKIVELLSESVQSPDDESAYFDCLMKHCVEKKPLSTLIKKKTVTELQEAIWANVEKKVYDRKLLLDSCFLPYITSSDLNTFFSKLTMVELGDIALTRLADEDFVEFAQRIVNNSPSSLKQSIFKGTSIKEFTKQILEMGTRKEIISSITHMFLTTEKNNTDLIQLFKLVSNQVIAKLPPSKLMELSIDFQKNIPIKD